MSQSSKDWKWDEIMGMGGIVFPHISTSDYPPLLSVVRWLDRFLEEASTPVYDIVRPLPYRPVFHGVCCGTALAEV